METTKYHPILFSTPMVQAILEGRKTQTRRVLKPAPIDKNNYHFEKLEKFGSRAFGMLPNQGVEIDNINNFPYNGIWFCPYNVGDVLWVRETFAPKEIYDEPPGVIAHYKATDSFASTKWKPSIFMPKQACRIFLKIKSIRVERLHDISKEDAIQEGIEFEIIDNIKEYKNYTAKSKEFGRYNDYSYPDVPQVSFMTLWESINGKESLELNPFVWVYEFEQIEKPNDFI